MEIATAVPLVEAGADGRMAALGHIEQIDSRWQCLGVSGGRVPGLSHCWAAWGLAAEGGGAAEAGKLPGGKASIKLTSVS